jgi:Nitrous oxidase accessory protein
MAIIRVKADYPSIQAAVDAAFPGDSIFVENDVYKEQVTISKDFIKLTGGDQTILDGEMKHDTGFILNNTNGVEIKSFLIKNYHRNGVELIGTGKTNKLVKLCILNINYFGIFLESGLESNLIAECMISGAYDGIYNNSKNLRIHDCKISYNSNIGVVLVTDTANADIRDNMVCYNYGIGIYSDAVGTSVIKNKIYGNSELGIYVASNSRAEENDIQSNGSGMNIYGQQCIIRRNRIHINDSDGILMTGGNNNVTSNVVEHNGRDGILINSVGNIIRDNIALGNKRYDIARIFPDNIVSGNDCRVGMPPELCSR